MAAVDLPVASEMLAYYDAIRPLIGGHELSRRPDPHLLGVTLITLDMEAAPSQARTMEIKLERVLHQGTRIASTTYFDDAGQTLATIEHPAGDGWINQL